MSSATQDNIPASVLDQALQWAVVMHSGTQSTEDQQAFDSWLAESVFNQIAWQRLQLIDQEFASVRPRADMGAKALKCVATQGQRKRWNKSLSALLSLTLLLGLVFALLPRATIWQAQYVTASGEQQQIQLASGARLYLNSNTALDIDKGDTVTQVRLYRGQLFVDSSAASSAQKPIIITDDGRFTPVGTRFCVHKQKQATHLSVTQGEVTIQTLNKPQARVRAKSGERWQVSEASVNRLAPSGLNPEGWLEGIIEADNARLGDVLDALSHYRRGWLTYDQGAEQLRVTGVFRLDDTESALNALEASMPLTIERTTRWWISVKAK
ncbi:MAG: FecR domain-containing protein [Spongiibacteraceae bacterium]|nr:FecR domain-containing protein [Spongiibacteraceae bacterium]